VSAEVFLMRDNRLAEFGQRQPAAVVSIEATFVTLPINCTQLVVEAGHRRGRTMRKSFQQIAIFLLIEDARSSQAAKMEQRVGQRVSSRDQLEHPHFGGAKPGGTGGKLA
jgi:hypothetical protein